MRIVLALCVALATTQATFRLRPATEAELKAVSSRTGAGLVVESVPASVAELKTGDLLAFADTTVLVSVDAFAQAVDEARGKPIDLLFYRGKTAQLASIVLDPVLFGRPSKEVDPPTPPPVKPVVPPPTPPAPPLGPGRAKVQATKFVPAEWEIVPGTASDAFPPDGGLRLGRAGRESKHARTAARRERLRGDFELTLEYEMLDWKPETMASTGFGIRFESPNEQQGEWLVTFDRTAGRERDEIVAAVGGPGGASLAAQPLGARGGLRVRRNGDAWRFAMRNAQDAPGAWKELGEFSARLAPDVQLWLTTHAVGKGETHVLVRELTLVKVDGQK